MIYKRTKDIIFLNNNIKVGDKITVYYKDIVINQNTEEVYQVEKDNKIIYDLAEYKSWIRLVSYGGLFCGICALIFTILRVRKKQKLQRSWTSPAKVICLHNSPHRLSGGRGVVWQEFHPDECLLDWKVSLFDILSWLWNDSNWIMEDGHSELGSETGEAQKKFLKES